MLDANSYFKSGLMYIEFCERVIRVLKKFKGLAGKYGIHSSEINATTQLKSLTTCLFTSFNQDLCAWGWGDKFPYGDSSRYMFEYSGCTFQATPNLAEHGPFCASACVSCFSSLVLY